MKRWTLLVTVCLIGGCARYINIPAQPGDIARHDPNLTKVGEVMTVAVQAAMRERPIRGEYVVVLPEGTAAPTYQQVIRDLPGAKAAAEGESGKMPTAAVKRLLVRGPDAEVDVVRQADTTQLITVYLHKYAFGPWQSQRVRVWSVDPEQALQYMQKPSAAVP
jgi:hypothetical protein